MKKLILFLAGGALLPFFACMLLYRAEPKPYANYYIPYERNLMEVGTSGQVRNTPRIFVEGDFLYVRAQSFDYKNEIEARADARNDMIMVVDKVTNKSGLGRVADKVEEKFIFIRTPLGEKKTVVEAIYAVPMDKLDVQTQTYLANEYGLKEAVAESVRIDSLRIRLEKLTGTMYSNPSMKDSVKILKFIKGVLDGKPAVFVQADPNQGDFVYIKGYSPLCPSRERAEHSVSIYLNSKVEELAGKQEVLQIITENKVVMEVVDILGTTGYVLEVLHKLPLKQFPLDIRNRLNLNYKQ